MIIFDILVLFVAVVFATLAVVDAFNNRPFNDIAIKFILAFAIFAAADGRMSSRKIDEIHEATVAQEVVEDGQVPE